MTMSELIELMDKLALVYKAKLDKANLSDFPDAEELEKLSYVSGALSVLDYLLGTLGVEEADAFTSTTTP